MMLGCAVLTTTSRGIGPARPRRPAIRVFQGEMARGKQFVVPALFYLP